MEVPEEVNVLLFRVTLCLTSPAPLVLAARLLCQFCELGSVSLITSSFPSNPGWLQEGHSTQVVSPGSGVCMCRAIGRRRWCVQGDRREGEQSELELGLFATTYLLVSAFIEVQFQTSEEGKWMEICRSVEFFFFFPFKQGLACCPGWPQTLGLNSLPTSPSETLGLLHVSSCPAWDFFFFFPPGVPSLRVSLVSLWMRSMTPHFMTSPWKLSLLSSSFISLYWFLPTIVETCSYFSHNKVKPPLFLHLLPALSSSQFIAKSPIRKCLKSLSPCPSIYIHINIFQPSFAIHL